MTSVDSAQATAALSGPLLQTRLHPPRMRSHLVQRTRLEVLLAEEHLQALTLVSAPAGYGKSTLVSHWLEARPEPSAWLSLSEDDNELGQFLRYVVAAVRTAFPQACLQTLSLLDAPELPPIAVLASSFINELDAIGRHLILVLDDYHNITSPAIHDLLSRLLHSPPHSLQLVLITRRDPPLPLAVLRARNQLADVRLEDLRFSAAETRDFLRHFTTIPVSDRALDTVNVTLEGWAVGLQLLGLALRNQTDPEDFLTQVRGNFLSVQDYLVEEVLNSLPPEIQTVLMRTSILDRFCPGLCEAVHLSSESVGLLAFDGQAFTDFLQHQNLFTIALDRHGEWFRYHHLFQQLLQQRLAQHSNSGDIADLHQRASAWCETHNLIDEAIQYALKAGAVERAVQLVEHNRHAELNADRWYVLERWLTKLPAQTLRQRPELLLVQAWVAYFRYELQKVSPLLESIELLLTDKTVRPATKEKISGEMSYFRGMLSFWQGQGERSWQSLAETLELLPETHRLARAETDLYMGLARHIDGQTEEAIQTLKEKIASASVSDPLNSTRWHASLSFIYLMGGELAQAAEAGQRVQSLAQTKGRTYAEAWGRYAQASAHLQSYELEAAVLHFRFTAEQRYRLHARAAVDALAGLALTYHALRQPDDVTKTLTQLREFARETHEPQNLSVAQSCQARLALLQGDPHAAMHWARSFAGKPDLPSLFLWLEVPAITQARVLAAVGSDDSLQEATDLLQALRQQTEAWHLICQTIEIMVLQALVLQKQGRADDALAVLAETVAVAGPRGWRRPFVEAGQPMADLLKQLPKHNHAIDYTEKILAAFEPSVSVSAPAIEQLIEPLTNREDEILTLLEQRLQDKEIATQLFISAATVKSHLKHLYQKLDVRTRRQAVTKARTLGLLRVE